jgi:peroxiredoxin Q/BCP
MVSQASIHVGLLKIGNDFIRTLDRQNGSGAIRGGSCMLVWLKKSRLDARRSARFAPGMRTALLLFSLLLVACEREPGATKATTTSSTASGAASAGELAIGAPAPDFTSTAHDGKEIKISALQGKHVVLYFYPKDETPGCTKEACAFRDAWKELEAKGVVLVGVSTDDVESHKKFAEHHKLPFHLVSDADGAIAKAYGVPNRLGLLGRQTFVIGPDGKLKKIYRSVDVSKHAAEILDDVRS